MTTTTTPPTTRKWGYAKKKDGSIDAQVFDVDAKTGALPEGWAESPAAFDEDEAPKHKGKK